MHHGIAVSAEHRNQVFFVLHKNDVILTCFRFLDMFYVLALGQQFNTRIVLKKIFYKAFPIKEILP